MSGRIKVCKKFSYQHYFVTEVEERETKYDLVNEKIAITAKIFITDFCLACTVDFRLKLEIRIDTKTDLKLIFHLRVWSVVLLIVSTLEKELRLKLSPSRVLAIIKLLPSIKYKYLQSLVKR